MTRSFRLAGMSLVNEGLSVTWEARKKGAKIAISSFISVLASCPDRSIESPIWKPLNCKTPDPIKLIWKVSQLFPIFELQNLSIDASGQHEMWFTTDPQALEFWEIFGRGALYCFTTYPDHFEKMKNNIRQERNWKYEMSKQWKKTLCHWCKYFLLFFYHDPTNPFTTLKLENMLIVFCKLHKARQSPDNDALQLREARSGTKETTLERADF